MRRGGNPVRRGGNPVRRGGDPVRRVSKPLRRVSKPFPWRASMPPVRWIRFEPVYTNRTS